MHHSTYIRRGSVEGIPPLSLFLQHRRMAPVGVSLEGSGGVLCFPFRGSLQVKSRRSGGIYPEVHEAIRRPPQGGCVKGFEPSPLERKGNHGDLFRVFSRHLAEPSNRKHAVRRGDPIDAHEFQKQKQKSEVVVVARSRNAERHGLCYAMDSNHGIAQCACFARHDSCTCCDLCCVVTHKFSKESVANSSVVVLARTDESLSEGQRFMASAT